MLQTARKFSMEMSREQCRAARALLKMSQSRLAAAAGVSLATIVNYELGTRRNVTPENVQRIRIALEVAGVMFDGNGGVKLRRDRRR
jgi:transcriptional regulator with XRE-family HTH domain